jgi:hypothetical protein
MGVMGVIFTGIVFEPDESILCAAIHAQSPKAIVVVLLKYGANPYLRTNADQTTPFELAQKQHRPDLIELFGASESKPSVNRLTIDTFAENSIETDTQPQVDTTTAMTERRVVLKPKGHSWFSSMPIIELSPLRKDSRPL